MKAFRDYNENEMIKNNVVLLTKQKKLLKDIIDAILIDFQLSPSWKIFVTKYHNFNGYPLTINWFSKTNLELFEIYNGSLLAKEKEEEKENFFVWGITTTVNRSRFSFSVYLNNKLFDKEMDPFELKDTVAHEFAHCVDFYLNGIRNVEHSYEWACIAKDLGADISYYRYHKKLLK